MNASIVEYLRYHKICGLARGRAEFGPRALGARSLLADPTVHNIKDVVNTIKNRQSFRPFAPVVPIEFASKYFDMHDEMVESPFMQYTVRCKMPKLLPGVVHVDGTSRVQTVKKSDAPRLHDLLLRWGKISGHPVLLNTSLNTRGEPILNDEYDVQLLVTEAWGESILMNFLKLEDTPSGPFMDQDTKELYKKNLRSQPDDWRYRNKLVKYTLNTHNYRTKEFNIIPWADSVVIFGCSFVFGIGAALDETIAAQLSSIIQKPVINMGAPGTSAMFSLYNSSILRKDCPNLRE